VKKSIHSEAHQALCSALTAERKKARLTQTALADRLERPQSFVAKVENGERRLDVVEFVHYCIALEIKPSKLLGALTRDQALWQ
jgi:transcriptional regulator with XRE-family HTH domain